MIDMKASGLEAACWKALQEVMDPEFPVSVVEMGLIYGITVKDGEAEVTMTYTAASCACMEWIEGDIRKRLLEEPGIHSARIQVVWDPPWTAERLSAAARDKLKTWGVSS